MTDRQTNLDTKEAPQPSTVYVHLCSGDVREITDVVDMATTNDKVIFFRSCHDSVILQRRDIYFSCCEANAEPSLF